MSGDDVSSRPPPRNLLDRVEAATAPRTEGELPWGRGDLYLLGQLGRLSVEILIVAAALYLLAPYAFSTPGGLLHVSHNTTTVDAYAAFGAGCLVLLVLAGLYVAQCRSWIANTMMLQTNVAWKDMVLAVGKRVKEQGITDKRVELAGRFGLRGYAFSIRADYAPLRVVGSTLGYVTWGGARSFLVVPLPLFRHPRWGQEIDQLARDILGWEPLEQVTTPSAPSVPSDDEP